MNSVLNQKKAVLSQDAGNDQNLPTSASIADLRIRSFMCAPLLTPDGRSLGILQLDTNDRKQFAQEDLDLLVAVASQASIAIQNASMHESLLARERIDRDLRLAEQIQRRFIPQTFPRWKGYEFFAYYQPAYEVGGDLYDFVPLAGDRLAIALGDVSGKGVSAALMMAKFSGDTRYCILTENSPGAAANRLNELLYSAGIDEKFITLCLGVLDRNSRRFAVLLGRPPACPGASEQWKVDVFGEENSGFPLGILPGSDYAETDDRADPGDVVVIYSDGVTDGGTCRTNSTTPRNPTAPQAAGVGTGRAGGCRSSHPPGHSRVLRGTRSDRRHHAGLLRATGFSNSLILWADEARR